MNVVVDTNIIVSALIKDSVTRELLLDVDVLFLCPEYVFIELNNHEQEILKKSKLSLQSYRSLMILLLKKIVIVPNRVLEPFVDKAKTVVEHIDSNDVLFVACALAYEDSVLWSNDSRLKQQRVVTVINTSEMINLQNFS